MFQHRSYPVPPLLLHGTLSLRRCADKTLPSFREMRGDQLGAVTPREAKKAQAASLRLPEM